MAEIKKVCVIGAGTMGSGIAAQIANAGHAVLLLDVASATGERNTTVLRALERIAKSDPPLLMASENLGRIEPGNIDDDLHRVSECDWIVEAIVERLDIKRNLYRSMLPHLKPEAFVSSNTSTIPIAVLMEDMPEALRQRFCITHFFNPVRYMRLLELVRGEETDPAVIDALADYCDRKLGKGVVKCADTPGFLGNRVGVFALQAAIHEATSMDIDIEDADAIFGRPMGIPKTGAFGLYDLIGLDLMTDVVRSLRSILPKGDPFFEVGEDNSLILSQIEQGFNGNKGKGGFYAERDGQSMALDLASGEWRARKRELPALAVAGEKEGVNALLSGEGPLSRFAWRVLARVLSYSASLVPDVTHTPQDIDDAMKLGYNWIKGPFELIDEIGSGPFVERLRSDGFAVPEFLAAADGEPFYKVDGKSLTVRHADGHYHPVQLPEGVMRFHMMRRTLTPVAENESASLFHLEDGLRLVEFHSKANALDSGSMAMVRAAANDPGPGVIVHNDGQHFSAGVNLERFLELIEAADWQGIDDFLKDFQDAVQLLVNCPAPVVGAPSGLGIGGGYEVLTHCDCLVAHANSVLGLVETAVGVVPGGGGVKDTYLRWYARTGDWEKAAWQTFNQIGYGQTGSSPDLSAELAYFLPDRDQQVMNRDRLLATAIETCKSMATGYAPRETQMFTLAGEKVLSAMKSFLEQGKAKGKFMPHDCVVAGEVGWIVCGEGDGSETATDVEMYAREREAFIRLAQTKETHARISGMLRDGIVPRN